MAGDIVVPTVGESITEGILSRWFKKDGDTVKADEPLYELETDKATSEVAAESAGVLHITVPEGEKVNVGSVIGRIEAGAAGARAPAKEPAEAKAKAAAPAEKKERPPAKETAPAKELPEGAKKTLAPSAQRLVAEKDLDAEKIPGTGKGGRITKEDVLAHLEAPQAPPSPAAIQAGGERRQRMTAIRQRIAQRLVESQQTTATLTTFNEADMSRVMTIRGQYKEAFQKKYNTGLGFMSFFVKACVEALRAFPAVNSRIEGADIVSGDACNIGVAVSSEKGLMVPVLRGAEQLSFAQIEQKISELSQKARAGKIEVPDLQGGTFTITNGGVFGSLMSTPILNPPQSAILGMHAIQKRPVAVGDDIALRPMMYLALSYDHRLIDGREAVLFLVRVKECVENPERLLLEV
jgi:2-oxoglutarate dehydrogenase E2 component (dihydrolipoamide succinyltransferase)